MVSVHKCKYCDEVFQEKFSLLEHQNLHTGETPFMCVYCRETFALIIHYVEHVKSTHLSHIESHDSDSLTESNGYTKKVVNINREVLNNEENDTEWLHKSRKESSECSVLSYSKDFKNDKSEDDIKGKSVKKSYSSKKLKNQKAKSKRHYCNFCKINLKTFKKYEEHNKKFHSFPCNNCNKIYPTKERRSKHFCRFLLAEKNIKCSCLQVFSNSLDFKNHIGEKPYKCCGCPMQFNTITNLIRHVRTHTKEKPYECKDCGRTFSQITHLKNHSSIHISVSAVQCTECNFSCKTVSGLLKHKKKHTNGVLNEEVYIDGRKKKNTTSCPVCNKKFLYKRNMGMHLKMHNNKESLCTECGKVFDSKSKLTSHYKSCHKDPSVCKTCGKVFASAVLLRYHEKIHATDELFTCDICSKTFSVKNYLIQHIKTHLNKKQYSCCKCGKLFKVAVSLKYHSNICV